MATLESRKTGLKIQIDDKEVEKFQETVGPGKHKLVKPDETKTPPEARKPARTQAEKAE
jgi:hypothetical protein